MKRIITGLIWTVSGWIVDSQLKQREAASLTTASLSWW